MPKPAEPRSIARLVEEARAMFVAQLSVPNTGQIPPLSAFNNAIAGFVARLEELTNVLRRVAAETLEYRTALEGLREVGKCHLFSVQDPICGRCIVLRTERGLQTTAIPATDGNVCSQCGARVCQQRPNETEEQ